MLSGRAAVRFRRRLLIVEVCAYGRTLWERSDGTVSPRTQLSLDSAGFDRRVRDDSPLHQELPAAAAARLQPSFVQPQQVEVRSAGGALADLGQHVDEADEFFGELGEHG